MDPQQGRAACPSRIILCGLLALVVLTSVVGSRPALAQSGDTSAANNTEEARPQRNIFVHIISSAGYFLPVLGLVSVALVALIVMLAVDLRMASSIPPAFVEEFTETVNKRRFKDAYELAKQENSFLGKVLAAGMARLQYGLEDARETAMNAMESVRASKEDLLTYIATIGTLGPMIGLVGTVYGMIRTFMVLGQGGQPRPADLAEGISEALVITLLGIGLAVPAIFCHAFFRNRLVRISLDTANIADDLLTQMYHFSKKPAVPEVVNSVAPAATEPVTPAPSLRKAQ